MARKQAPKPARRKPGTGTVRYRKGRAQPYEAAYPLEGGETRYDSFDTRAAALAHLDALVAEQASGTRNIAGGSMLVSDFLEMWLSIKDPHIKRTTYQNYRYLLGFAMSYFAGRRIDTVQRPDAELFLTQFAKKRKNAMALRAVCRQAFEYAVEEEYIKKNPFQKAKAPEQERRTGRAITKVQRGRLLELARGTPFELLWHLYSRLGLRRGEGMALLWANVDLDAATISIEQQFSDVNGVATKSTPKTKRSRRIVPLPDDMVELFRAHKQEQTRRAAHDPEWTMSGLVFTDEHGGALTIWHVRTHWYRLRKAAQLGTLRIHDLRHTALTILALDGVPENIRMALAGHTSGRMSGHYADHATIEDVRKAVG